MSEEGSVVCDTAVGPVTITIRMTTLSGNKRQFSIKHTPPVKLYQTMDPLDPDHRGNIVGCISLTNFTATIVEIDAEYLVCYLNLTSGATMPTLVQSPVPDCPAANLSSDQREAWMRMRDDLERWRTRYPAPPDLDTVPSPFSGDCAPPKSAFRTLKQHNNPFH